MQSDPRARFRPGQIFSAQITSGFTSKNYSTFRKIDLEYLPLEPFPSLKATAEEEQLQNRSRRLAQIRQLPLEKMTRYCEDVARDGSEVHCLLCSRPGQPSKHQKDDWASDHFRLHHWEYYFGMVPGLSSRLSRETRVSVIAWEQQSEASSQPPERDFSAERWITVDDVTLDTPIKVDDEIASVVNDHSQIHYWPLPGPIMIQRFVVVREGDGQCLVLGIHTSVKPPVRFPDHP